MNEIHTKFPLGNHLAEKKALFLVFLVPICAVSFHQYVTVVLAVSFFSWLVMRKKTTVNFDVRGRHWFWFILAFFCVSLLSLVISGEYDAGAKELDKYSRLLLCWPLMYILARFKWHSSVFWLGVAMAGMYSGLSSFIDVFVLNVDRANSFGMLNPIFFGGFSLLFGFLSFIGSLMFIKEQKKKCAALCFLGSLGGCVAVIFSGSRGGLLAFPYLAVLGAIYLLFFKHFKVFFFLLVLALIGIGTVATKPNSMTHRIDIVDDEVSGYINDGKVNTSVGLRLFMWETAWYGFLDKPILGHGPGSFSGLPYKSFLRSEYKETVNLNSHAHSEYLHNMVTKGFLGLVTLLGVFLMPFALSISFMMQKKYEIGIALSGVVGAFMIFSLTDMALMRGSGADLFTFLVSVLFVIGSRKSDVGSTPPAQ